MRKHPLLWRTAVFVLVPGFLAAFFLNQRARSGLPVMDGALEVSAITSPASISRDPLGVAYIEGEDAEAVYFATGFAHAQDRLWQMEIQRRMAGGRLAEVFGAPLLESDAWFRALRLYDAARDSWSVLSPRARASLTAYAHGVNAHLATTTGLPPQFGLYGVAPEAWSEVDSLAWFKAFAFSLSGNMSRESEAFVSAARLAEPDAWRLLHPAAEPRDAPITCASCPDDTLKAVLENLRQGRQSLRQSSSHSGSNAWVVAGDPATGAGPQLANDPHLGLQIPSPWYVVSTRAPDFSSAGMTLVGLPPVIFGHNDTIAWGGTSMMADVQDLYLEELDPADPRRYRAGDGWLTFEETHESIAVRPAFPTLLRNPKPPAQLRLRKSVHGPVVNVTRGTFDQPVALRWTGFTSEDRSYEALFLLTFARTWEDFNAALARLTVPAMNMVYADRSNNIGYIAAGRIPIRQERDGSQPVKGALPENEWTGFVPPEAMPRLFNPSSGRIVTANNRVAPDDYPFFISKDWADPARATRIDALLEELRAAGQPADLDAMKRIQADTLDLSVPPLLEALRKVNVTDPDVAKALSRLNDWNGDHAPDARAPALYQGFIRALKRRLFESMLTGVWGETEKEAWAESVMASVDARDLAAILGDSTVEERWCRRSDDSPSLPVPGCAQVVEDAMRDALSELVPFSGRGGAPPKWSDIHAASYEPVPGAYPELAARYLRRRVPNGGSANSVNVASSRFEPTEGYLQDYGASFRQVIQMSATGPVRHAFMNSTGQSEHPLSPHYDDMLESFHAREHGELRAGPERDWPRLRLVPSASGARP